MNPNAWYTQWDKTMQSVFECAPSPEDGRWWCYLNGALLRACSEPLSEQGVRLAMELWGFRAPAGREDPGSWDHRAVRVQERHPMWEKFPLVVWEG